MNSPIFVKATDTRIPKSAYRNMTDTTKPVTRRTVAEHSRHRRRIVATVGPGDTLAFRLERGKQVYRVPIETVFDWAELRHAQAISGFNAAPCNNPKKVRNV